MTDVRDTAGGEAGHEWLAGRFEAERGRLRGVAYRMLGSMSEADDAVQESWLRLNRADTSAVVNLSGWLTTVVGRVCLDMLRSRTARREEPLEPPEESAPRAQEEDRDPRANPEQEALMAESVGAALLVTLETLEPAERLAFVLHDVFAVPFEEIAPVVGRSVAATRQLASRARRRVRGWQAGEAGEASETGQADSAVNDLRAPAVVNTARPLSKGRTDRQREIVSAFLAAARGGDFEALLNVLDPSVRMRSDAAAQLTGAAAARGADAVARQFSGRARAARLALVDGKPGLIWAAGGQVRVVFTFTLRRSKITSISLIADPERIAALTVSPMEE